LLIASIEEQNLLNNLCHQIDPWISGLISKEPFDTANALVGMKNQLYLLLETQKSNKHKGLPPSMQEIEGFLVHGFFPASYASSTAWIKVVLKESTQSTIYRQALLKLLKQKLYRQNFVNATLQHAGLEMLSPLIPLSEPYFVKYTNLLLGADVLNAGPISEKKKILADIFLSIISQMPDASEAEFMQLTLTAVSQRSPLPQQEVYKRINRVLGKQAYGSIEYILEPLSLSPLPESGGSFDLLDFALWPVYKKLKTLLPLLGTKQQFDSVLLPTMKQMLIQVDKQSNMKVWMRQLIEQAFPSLNKNEYIKFVNTITQTVQAARIRYKKYIKDIWLYFLHTGELKEPYKNIASLLKDLKTLSVDDQRQTFNKITKNPHTRKRLISSLSHEELAYLLKLLPLDSVDELIETIDKIAYLCTQVDIKADKLQVKLTWREVALSNLTPLMRPGYPKKSWLASSLKDMADSFGLHPSFLIRSLNDATQMVAPTTSTQKELDQLLKSIYQDWAQAISESAQQAWPQKPILQSLHQLLTVGISAFSGYSQAHMTKLEKQALSLIKQNSADLRSMLYSLAQPVEVAKRLAHYFSSRLIKRLIQFLGGPSKSIIQSYLDFSTGSVDKANSEVDLFSWNKNNEVAMLTILLEYGSNQPISQQQWCTRIVDLLTEDESQHGLSMILQLIDHHRADPVHQSLCNTLIAILQTRNLSNVKATQGLTEKDIPSANAVLLNKQEEEDGDQEIKVYVKNGGIIFLWPYIENFLSKQGLMEDQSLVGYITTNNAVHALQYLVTQRLQTPDWHLTLNKLLCGMSYDQVATVGYYLPKERSLAKDKLVELAQKYSKNSDNKEFLHSIPQMVSQIPKRHLPSDIKLLVQNDKDLFGEVFAKWVNLKKLEDFEPYKSGFTMEDFQAYFLRREGILQRVSQADQAYWHLTLTIEPYDSPEILPPWPIKNIRLPWMKEDLVVCWIGD
jgi:hypothetical protein